MKKYPKVPRWDHPVVEDGFYNQELTVVEKMDGSNFRFMVYEEDYSGMYEAEVEEHNPEDGDVLIGTKNNIRGTIDEDINSFAGNVRRSINQLRDNLMVDEVKKISEEGPVVFFAENMVRHTLDYGYDENKPPAMIGFDVYFYSKDNREEYASHPYEETFEGFVEYDKMCEIFERIFDDDSNVDVAPIVDEGIVNPEEINIPISNYANIQAEGVVFRSNNRRTKFVRDEFKELNKQMFGSDFAGELEELLEDVDNSNKVKTAEVINSSGSAGASYIVDKFATSNRIRKHIQKMLDDGHNFGMELMSELPNRVENDIWTEEVHEIANLDMNINPSRVSDHVARRCKNELTKVKQNMEMQDVEDPTELW